MSEQSNQIDVVGIGNALVDVLTHTDDAFVEGEGLVKGSMTLIDAERAVELYASMGATDEVSGGSAANTIVGVAALGASSAGSQPTRSHRRRRPVPSSALAVAAWRQNADARARQTALRARRRRLGSSFRCAKQRCSRHYRSVPWRPVYCRTRI